MADNNIKIVNKAFKGYAEHIDKVTYNALDKWCVDILRNACRFRMNQVGGHNFTGNLINSICVLLYRKSKGTVTSYFAYDKAGLKLPIRRELSGLNSRGKQRKNRIFFRPGSRFGDRDWMDQWSSLKPDTLIGTDESWGQNDAQRFAASWVPSTPDCDFVICVAYTSEYASFVEHERHTTGILETESYVGHSAIEWVGLKQAA